MGLLCRPRYDRNGGSQRHVENMVSTYHFEDDLPTGRRAEREAVQVLQAYFPRMKDVVFCKDHKYDFSADLDGRRVSFEVKWDGKAPATGNVAVEFESRGKLSGIAMTKADYYVYKVGEADWHLVETIMLQKKLKEKKYPRVKGGDEGSETRMVLVPVEEFASWCIRIG